MKAFVTFIALALAIVAIGFLYSGKTGGSPVSSSDQAIKLCEEGTADFHAYRLNDAQVKLESCLELDPNLAEASISLAFTFGRLGRIPEFMTTLARADSLTANIGDDDRRMMAQLRLGVVSESQFYSIRDSLLKRLQVEKPNNLEVLVALAGKAKSDEDKEKAWRGILKVDPNYAVAYNMLGYHELSRGNYDQAIEHMQKYAFLAPDLANPHDSLGDVYFAQGRYEEAEAAYVQSVTMQPDFYASLINLGKTYLARGQIKKGVDILTKVGAEVGGSQLEQKVDREILMTLVLYGLDDDLAHRAPEYVQKWPEDGNAAFFRAMNLAFQGDFQASQAVMDSALTMWRVNEHYQSHSKQQSHIERAAKRYQALISDLADSPSTRVRHWASLVALNSDVVIHEQWYDRWRLGEALLDNGQIAEAIEQIAPSLEVNPRLINPLILAVKVELAASHPERARHALDQAKWALSKADKDFPPVLELKELEARVLELEGSS